MVLIGSRLWSFCYNSVGLFVHLRVGSRQLIIFSHLSLVYWSIELAKINTFVEHNGLKLTEGLVDHITENGIGSKGDFPVSTDNNTLSRVDVNALTVFHVGHFECAEALDFDLPFGVKTIVHHVKQSTHKRLCLGFGQSALLRED